MKTISIGIARFYIALLSTTNAPPVHPQSVPLLQATNYSHHEINLSGFAGTACRFTYSDCNGECVGLLPLRGIKPSGLKRAWVI